MRLDLVEHPGLELFCILVADRDRYGSLRTSSEMLVEFPAQVSQEHVVRGLHGRELPNRIHQGVEVALAEEKFAVRSRSAVVAIERDQLDDAFAEQFIFLRK